MKENKVERYLKTQVEKHGGMCEKFVSPGKRDVPDRLITWDVKALPHHQELMELAETKAPGKKPRVGQLRDHKERNRRGVLVSVLDTIEAIDAWIASRYPVVAKAVRAPRKAREVHQGKPVHLVNIGSSEPNSNTFNGDISDLI